LIHRAKLHVRSILADLSPRDAEVLSLIYGLTPAGFITAREAARRTGCSDKTIQNIKRRHLPAGLWRLPRGGFAGKNWAQRASEVECPAP
jgi:DNA-directed RNA polymerase specialized sigma24 family protein